MTDKEKKEFEKLRKNMPWMRAFARNVEIVMNRSMGESDKTRIKAIRELVGMHSNQWPNWLDEDIEKMVDEEEQV